jgi:threonine/homoserine/homoserine lactone efflux protein
MLKNRNNTQLNFNEDDDKRTGKLGYMVGLVVTLANPKVIFFYVSFLPNFMDLQSLNVIDILIVIAVIAVVLAISMGFYAWLAYSARHAVVSEAAQKRLNIASGILILLTGAIFALKMG